MPGRPQTHTRTVGFAPVPASYSRLPHDDEKLVMRRFAKHAAECHDCLVGKGDLCAKGYARAKDVQDYVFQKGGLLYSVIDLDSGTRMEIEIPGDCGSIRDLFRGISRGLRVRGGVAATSPSLSSSPSSTSSAYAYSGAGSNKSHGSGKSSSQRHNTSSSSRHTGEESRRHHSSGKSSSSHHHSSHSSSERRHERPSSAQYMAPVPQPTYYQVGAYGVSPVTYGYAPSPVQGGYGYYA